MGRPSTFRIFLTPAWQPGIVAGIGFAAKVGLVFGSNKPEDAKGFAISGGLKIEPIQIVETGASPGNPQVTVKTGGGPQLALGVAVSWGYTFDIFPLFGAKINAVDQAFKNNVEPFIALTPANVLNPAAFQEQ